MRKPDTSILFQGIAIRQKIRTLFKEQRVSKLVFLARKGPVQKKEVELYLLKRQSRFKEFKGAVIKSKRVSDSGR